MDDIAPGTAEPRPRPTTPGASSTWCFTTWPTRVCTPSSAESGDPGPPAAALLLALGIEPAAEGNREVMRDVRAHLATIRTAVFGDR